MDHWNWVACDEHGHWNKVHTPHGGVLSPVFMLLRGCLIVCFGGPFGGGGLVGSPGLMNLHGGYLNTE